MSERLKVRVVAALISHPSSPGRYLIQQRLPGERRGLLWEFPGGKVETGESDPSALARECREELAVELRVLELALQTLHHYADLSVELLLYRAEILSGEPRPLGAKALSWATVAEMKALPFCEADVPLLERLEGR